MDVSCAAASAYSGAIGRALRTSDLAYGQMSALAAGMGLDLGGGAAFRGPAIGALLDDVAIAARHGELQKDEADLVKRILQGDGIDNGRRVTTFLLQRRRQNRATAAAAAAAVSAVSAAARGPYKAL